MPRSDDAVVRAALLVLGVYQLGLGGLMAFAPATFYELLGPFAPYNVHYVRDAATWELALAAGAFAAAARPAWRVPVLAVAFVHAVLHALNHLLDVGQADPAWVGVFNLVSLLALAAALAWLTVRAHRPATERSPT
ncbi:MAG: hypothetical protein M3459_09390 [Actinomycetota bacterium]|nr:hypothetical protein [Actinomycetota bacterium]